MDPNYNGSIRITRTRNSSLRQQPPCPWQIVYYMVLISTCLINQQRWLLLLLITLFLLLLTSATKQKGDVASYLRLKGFQTTPTPPPIFLRLVVGPIAYKVLPHAAAIYTESQCISNSYKSVPRGGGRWQRVQNSKYHTSTTGNSHAINGNIADDESSDEPNSNDVSLHEDGDDIVSMPLPRRLLTVAKNIVGRTANIIFSRLRQQQIPQTQFWCHSQGPQQP